MVYVTPSHQFPSGAVMSASRRLELLAWAEQTGAVILEDDYCSEFRYDGSPLAALQGLDTNGRVAYAGTLSKVLQPGIRVGHIVAPPSLMPALRVAKMLADRHVPLLTQAVLSLFLSEGYFDRHLRRMRKIYRARRDVLVAALHEHFGSTITISGTASGMHMLLTIDGVANSTAFIAAAAQQEVRIQDARPYYAAEPPGACFLAGYCGRCLPDR
jgi:GntR family transcriptional regulator/MocR family aminotransferase